MKLAADKHVHTPSSSSIQYPVSSIPISCIPHRYSPTSILHAGLLLLLSALAAYAYPPGPYHLLYGTVRDRYGTPITTANAQVIFQTPSGTQFFAPIIPGLNPGVNYFLKVPMDSGAAPDLYAPNVQVPAAPFKLLVVLNSVTNTPIEMSTNIALGLWTKSTRLDLTLGADINGDGIPDSWEYAFLATLGLNIPLSSINANSVLTPDGLTIRQQYLMGTYPFDPGDPLRIVFIGFNAGAPMLQFPTVAGRSYTVLASADLKTWSPVAFHLSTDSPGAASRPYYVAPAIATIQVNTLPAPLGASQQFYRIMVQ